MKHNKGDVLVVKKLLITLSILTVICIFGLIIYSSGRTYYNDDFVTGNNAGNLYNGGLFCEYNNKIYFSNDSDEGALYVMNPDLKNVKKVHDDKAAYINIDDNYIYYVRTNNTRENHKGSFFMFYSTGVYRINHNGSNLKMISHSPAGVLGLSGNFLFYQRYDADTGLNLYYSKIDGSGENLISEDSIIPASIKDNYLLFSGTNMDHNISSMNLETFETNTLIEANTMYPISIKNKIYYINLEDNYSIYRCKADGTQTERVVNQRCSTYNITLDGTYLYYQIDDGENNGIHRLNLSTDEDELILEGDYKQIHVTDKYVFFKDFNNESTYMLAANGTGKLGSFNPPVIKEK